jgi:hypothetical protein
MSMKKRQKDKLILPLQRSGGGEGDAPDRLKEEDLRKDRG